MANRDSSLLDPITCSIKDARSCILEFHSSLGVELMGWAASLLEKNMRPLYEDGWGWDGDVKRGELQSPKARFILSSLQHADCQPKPNGFIHYRFVSDERRPVLYVFEIQIDSSSQGLGVGRHLMNAAEKTAKAAGMSFVLLTVFKHNAEALKFYKKLGYSLDSKASADGDCFQELCKQV
mmetsp:Transcript_38717/g.77653  ORF Transcript_38717/g.77653 Transcript_38717/m.77653 type:complete len:180 (+) Transcript_38717:170-709(+)